MTNKTAQQELLDIAMGVAPMAELTDDQKVANSRKQWMTLPTDRKLRILHRRKLREAMFKILKYEVRNMPDKMTTELFALKSIIDEQLDSNMGMKWEGFTFVWDIHPTGNPVVIRKEAWVKEGGLFDQDIGVHTPAAFTGQEIS